VFKVKGKGKVLPYSLPIVGPGANPSAQAVSPQVTLSHPSGGRLPLLSAKPAVTCVAFIRWHHTVAQSDSSLLLIYRLQNDERLSWPGWLICSGWFNHNCGHPSAAGRTQDRESLPARDQCSTTVPRNQFKVIVD